MPKRTYNPKKKSRKRKLGFLAAKKRNKRKNVVAARRKKGRKRLAPV